MRMTRTRQALCGAVAAALTGGLAITAAAPAQAAAASCTTDAYRVVWPVAGVYDQLSQSSYQITTKQNGERVTGPAGDLAHVRANGYSWTKVWVKSVPGWREGWMRDDAVTYVGCA
jgi:hypothetical protein